MVLTLADNQTPATALIADGQPSNRITVSADTLTMSTAHAETLGWPVASVDGAGTSYPHRTVLLSIPSVINVGTISQVQRSDASVGATKMANDEPSRDWAIDQQQISNPAGSRLDDLPVLIGGNLAVPLLIKGRPRPTLSNIVRTYNFTSENESEPRS